MYAATVAMVISGVGARIVMEHAGEKANSGNSKAAQNGCLFTCQHQTFDTIKHESWHM